MKVVQKFCADDGSEFDTEQECLAHEALCVEIAKIMEPLPKRPDTDGCRFENGHGYLQHDKETFSAAKIALLRIGLRLIPHEWLEQSIADLTTHPSWCGSLFDEIGGPLPKAWWRMQCVDDQLREWGQPYYANHPEAAWTVREIRSG